MCEQMGRWLTTSFAKPGAEMGSSWRPSEVGRDGSGGGEWPMSATQISRSWHMFPSDGFLEACAMSFESPHPGSLGEMSQMFLPGSMIELHREAVG